jgi:hypothetical protein
MKNPVESDRELIGEPDENPFCQLVGRPINTNQCFEMQGQPGCFGCAANTRLCEDCTIMRVDVPAVGLCSPCIVKQLAIEDKTGKPVFKSEELVPCQIVRRSISTEMCLATQGQEECSKCPAASRLCEKCKTHSCRFPQYGLCLKCSVEEFGEGWEPKEATRLSIPKEEPAEQVPEPENPHHAAKSPSEEILAYMPKARYLTTTHKKVSAAFLADKLKVRRHDKAQMILEQLEAEGFIGPPAYGSAPRDVLPGATIEAACELARASGVELCKRCHTRPISIKQRGLCKACSAHFYRSEKKPISQEEGARSILLFESEIAWLDDIVGLLKDANDKSASRSFVVHEAIARLKDDLDSKSQPEVLQGFIERHPKRVRRLHLPGETMNIPRVIPEMGEVLPSARWIIRQKIAKLEELLGVLGKGDFSEVLQSIVVDLQRLGVITAVVDDIYTDDASRLFNRSTPHPAIDPDLAMKVQMLQIIRDMVATMTSPRLSLKEIARWLVSRYGANSDIKITAQWVGIFIRKKLSLRTERNRGEFVIAASETAKLNQLYEIYGVAAKVHVRLQR